MSITPKDYHKTIFTTPWSTFVYIVMPFGLCNALAAFQRVMTQAFSDLLHKSRSIFIDDFSTQTSKIDHMVMLKACFDRCHHFGIALNLEKIYLAVNMGFCLIMWCLRKVRSQTLKKLRSLSTFNPQVMSKECKGS